MQLPPQRQSKTEALRETEHRHERMPTLNGLNGVKRLNDWNCWNSLW